jgi:hypothetical protein
MIEDRTLQAVQALEHGYASGALGTKTFERRMDAIMSVPAGTDVRPLVADLLGPPTWRRSLTALAEAARDALPAPRLRPSPIAAHPLVSRARVLLGRGLACQFVFADNSVSRRHAELRLEDGLWHLRDLGSLNGTWVNGRRVREAEVRPGDEIRLGAVRFRL